MERLNRPRGGAGAKKKRETGVRLYEDQIEKLEMIVTLGNGREDRSRLIREGIDMVIAQRLQTIIKNAHTNEAAEPVT